MTNWTERSLECAKVARAALRLPLEASPVAVILGSGLGSFADSLLDARGVTFRDLPHFPPATVVGHSGRLVYGTLEGLPVLALQGRLHGYEGHDAATCALPARLLAVLGSRALICTNAAGACNPAFEPGDLMRIDDHLNLTGKNPLTGPNEDRLGPRFPDLTRAYDRRLSKAIEEAALETGNALRHGVYAQFNGPSYETPAEVRMARALGADAVGMSTVPEVIVAAQQGLPCCGISCITNHAAGIAEQPLNHEEVVEVASRTQPRFLALLRALVRRAHESVNPREPLA